MKKGFISAAEYRTPVCTITEISQEGILCASFGNETFTTDGTTYGSGSENNGWQ